LAGPAGVWTAREGIILLLLLVVQYCNLHQLLRDQYSSTTGSDNDDQSQKGTQLLEIYALEIQMYNETRNFKKLKAGVEAQYLST
jgi:hypothetical protein